ncbi:UvrD-helicase domain-containing protein [bacterium]|nr:UvrD-helicase domain-containing protein [bacterium]
MEGLLDGPEREQIAGQFGKNFLVEASAGSGKTHSLVGRLVAGILAGAYEIEKLVAVTFTRKAAAELSGRMRLALQAACQGRDAKSAERALAQFDKMFIGTVHGFCSRLLREYPVQAGISPVFQEMEEDEDQLLQRRVLRTQLDEPSGRRLLRLLREFGAGPVELQSALGWMTEYGELDYVTETVDRPDLETAWQEVDAMAHFLGDLLPPCDERQPTCKLLLASQSLLRRVRWSDRATPRDLLKLLEEWETEPAIVMKYWGANRAAQNELLDRVKERAQHFRDQVVLVELSRWRSYLYSQIVPFVLHTRQACEQERKLNGLVNFNDLLRLTCRLIQEPRVRRDIQARLQHLCVDEFQDTDPLQAQLFFLICADDPEEQNWLMTRPRPGSLFLVGDPKQSIYRFRRADIETYNRARQIIQETGGQVVSLRTSFRSVPDLCSWTNQVFTQLLPSKPTVQQAGYDTIQALPGEAKGRCVERMVHSGMRYSEVAAAECRLLAAWVARKLKAGYLPSDFLLLTARKADLRLYQQAFTDAQIPCQVSAEPAPLSARGRAFLRLLHVLADSRDRVALVGVLRGPLFGHSDDELFQSFHLKSSNEVDTSLRLIGELRLQVRYLPPGAAASLVMRQMGLHLKTDLELEGIVDYLCDRGQKGLTLGQGLRELLEAEAIALPPSPGGHEGVRIMNVHKAKGLEARVVVLASPTSGLPAKAEHSVTKGRGSFCLFRNRRLLAHPANWSEIEQREIEFVQAEHLRLLYVAATRARECLVVSQWAGNHASALRPWVALDPFLADLEPLELKEAAPADIGLSTQSLESILSQEEQRATQLAECARPGWRRQSVTANNHTPGLHASPGLSDEPVGGTGWGDLIHRLLEQLVLRPSLTREQLASLARWFTYDTPELAEHLDTALDTLEKIRGSEFWGRVLAAKQRLVEVPFGKRAGNDLLFGTIDLALEQAESWDIVDYKTDRKNLDQIIAHYAGQVALYARSWKDITAQDVGYAGIYSVRESKLSEDLR